MLGGSELFVSTQCRLSDINASSSQHRKHVTTSHARHNIVKSFHRPNSLKDLQSPADLYEAYRVAYPRRLDVFCVLRIVIPFLTAYIARPIVLPRSFDLVHPSLLATIENLRGSGLSQQLAAAREQFSSLGGFLGLQMRSLDRFPPGGFSRAVEAADAWRAAALDNARSAAAWARREFFQHLAVLLARCSPEAHERLMEALLKREWGRRMLLSDDMNGEGTTSSCGGGEKRMRGDKRRAYAVTK